MENMNVAIVLVAFALVATTCLTVNATEIKISQAELTTIQLNTMQGQLEALNDLVHAQALRITQLESQLDVDANHRRLEKKDVAGTKKPTGKQGEAGAKKPTAPLASGMYCDILLTATSSALSLPLRTR